MRGVSLVELVAAVTIAGILGAVAVSQFGRTNERVRASEATHYLATLRTAQARYRAENGQYTDQLNALDTELPTPPGRWTGPSLSGPGATGLATFTRNSGAYQGQTLGIAYGSATLCGTFAPLAPLPPCQAD